VTSAGTSRRPGGRTAAFFDLDKTIIAKSSTLAFSRQFYEGGLITRRAMLKSTYAQFVFLAGGAGHDEMDKMRNYMQHLVAGWDVQQVRDIVAETLHELIDPLIYDEAASLIEEHHQAGRDVVIVSSSGEEVVVPIGEMLGADRVIATKMVVEDGRYTGAIAFYAYADNKASAIRGLADEVGYDLAASYAYSDSVTDVPMLETVGHPSVVNPDRGLRKEAAARGWDVLEFRKPVSLRTRMPSLPTPTGPVVAGMAVGAGVAAAGWFWYARHRSGRATG
jgi:HAD superfamily hydrolase (TIGR01490 family)